MIYQSKILERIEKYKAFFADSSPGQILATICPYTFPMDYSRWGLENRALSTWNSEEDIEAYIDYEVKKLRCFLEYTRDLDNDYIPSLNGGFGIGINSAYFSGMDITVGVETSWVHPYIKDWKDINKLKRDENSKWYKILKRMVSRIVELSEGDYLPSSFSHFAPFDMANALRGNQIFYDLYDEPERVHQLMDISADAIIWLEMELRKMISPVQGGTAIAGMWFPGNALFLSEDASDLCSADIYTEFAKPYTQKVLEKIGGAYIHHHAKGFHIHKGIAGLEKLKTLEISWDPNCPRPIDCLGKVYEDTGSVPLMTRCTAKDVYEKIDEMKQGRLVLMLDVCSLEEGREVMSFIRKHSTI